MPSIGRSLCAIPLTILTACAVERAPTQSAPQKAAEEHYFDCDVPPATYSEWRRTTSSATLKVAGTIQLIRPREDKQWVPGANVFLMSRDEKKTVGIQFSVQSYASDKLQVKLLSGSGKSMDTPAFAARAWREESLPFSLYLDANGLLTAEFAGVSSSRQVDGLDLHEVALGCSTGQFKFQHVFITEQ
jgi:hypothetical protein